MMTHYESLLIENVLIYDGTGLKPYLGWVLIQEGRIAAVGNTRYGSCSLNSSSMFKRFDGHGLAISPGFINIHSHSDTDILLHPECKTLVKQGITTETIGNCGSSAIYTWDFDTETWNRIFEKSHVNFKWNGVTGYLNAVSQVSPAVNVVPLFGHGDIRHQIVGDDGRSLNSQELVTAEKIAKRYMQEGAFGFSSGLEYVPGRFADGNEIAAVCRGIGTHGGMHATHLRNEGPGLLDAVREVIDAASMAKSNLKLEISHLKACGPSSWGSVKEALALLDQARVSGLDVAADFYPYLASSTSLPIVLPDWVLEKGTLEAISMLKDPNRCLEAEVDAHQRTMSQGGWERIVITGVRNRKNKWMEGLNLSDIAQRLGKRPAQAAISILIDEDMKVRIARFAISEDDLCTVMRHPNTCVITDGSNAVPEDGKIHPRSIGTFPRVLGHYAREKGVITMEEAVRKMTSLPASRLGLLDRGKIAPKFWADLVIFDKDTIIDQGTYEDPWRYPIGIFGVIVNGCPVVWEGELTGLRSGVGLCRGGIPVNISNK
jgi:N-acyl-D-amino-acid deacylase